MRSRLLLCALLLLAACTPVEAAGPAPVGDLHRDAEVFAAVGRLLAGARERVWVEMYEFGRRDLADALVAGRRRGLDVRLVTDPTVDVSRATAARLRAAGVPVRLYPVDESVYQIDHVKLLIADGAALAGGMNWGATSARNHDYALELHDPARVRRLAAIFQADWALAGGEQPPPAAAAVAGVYQTSPGQEIRGRLLALAAAARREIDVEAFVLSDLDVADALELAHLRAVRVRVLLDPKQDSNLATCAALRLGGVEVAWFPLDFHPKLHAKAGLFDGRLLLGSANWSVGGLSHNHELDVESDRPADAALFRAWFDADWAQARPWWKWWLGLAC